VSYDKGIIDIYKARDI